MLPKSNGTAEIQLTSLSHIKRKHKRIRMRYKQGRNVHYPLMLLVSYSLYRKLLVNLLHTKDVNNVLSCLRRSRSFFSFLLLSHIHTQSKATLQPIHFHFIKMDNFLLTIAITLYCIVIIILFQSFFLTSLFSHHHTIVYPAISDLCFYSNFPSSFYFLWVNMSSSQTNI